MDVKDIDRLSHRAAGLVAALTLATLASTSVAEAAVKSESFGTTKDGQAVELYTITNASGASVKFMSYGGIITEINVPDRWGHLGNVVLGFTNVADYEAKSPYFGGLIGRYANRIDAGKFSLDGPTIR